MNAESKCFQLKELIDHITVTNVVRCNGASSYSQLKQTLEIAAIYSIQAEKL